MFGPRNIDPIFEHNCTPLVEKLLTYKARRFIPLRDFKEDYLTAQSVYDVICGGRSKVVLPTITGDFILCANYIRTEAERRSKHNNHATLIYLKLNTIEIIPTPDNIIIAFERLSEVNGMCQLLVRWLNLVSPYRLYLQGEYITNDPTSSPQPPPPKIDQVVVQTKPPMPLSPPKFDATSIIVHYLPPNEKSTTDQTRILCYITAVDNYLKYNLTPGIRFATIPISSIFGNQYSIPNHLKNINENEIDEVIFHYSSMGFDCQKVGFYNLQPKPEPCGSNTINELLLMTSTPPTQQSYQKKQNEEGSSRDFIIALKFSFDLATPLCCGHYFCHNKCSLIYDYSIPSCKNNKIMYETQQAVANYITSTTTGAILTGTEIVFGTAHMCIHNLSVAAINHVLTMSIRILYDNIPNRIVNRRKTTKKVDPRPDLYKGKILDTLRFLNGNLLTIILCIEVHIKSTSNCNPFSNEDISDNEKDLESKEESFRQIEVNKSIMEACKKIVIE